MKVIKCVCGFEILVIPDKTAMAQAIDQHAETHALGQRDLIQNYLLGQLFDTITS